MSLTDFDIYALADLDLRFVALNNYAQLLVSPPFSACARQDAYFVVVGDKTTYEVDGSGNSMAMANCDAEQFVLDVLVVGHHPAAIPVTCVRGRRERDRDLTAGQRLGDTHAEIGLTGEFG